jgi:hypothetical protein
MKCLLVTTAIAAALIGQANAQTKFTPTPEQAEDMMAVMQMAEHVKKLPTQQRDEWERSAAGALLYDDHCEKLPQRVRVAMTGVMAGDSEKFMAHQKGLDYWRQTTGNSEFCTTLKPAIEKLKQDFASRGI